MLTLGDRSAFKLPPGVEGLSAKEAEVRLVRFGQNVVTEKRKLSGVASFFLRFKNPLILTLLGAAAVSAFLGNTVDPLIIIIMVILSVVIDFLNTHKSERAAEALREQVAITSTVLRDGFIGEVPLSLIVPGDVVVLSPGDVVPADGVVIEADDFFLNESALTGESFPREKRSGEEVFMGTSVVTGTGLMEVRTTGRKTRWSGIAESLVRREAPNDFDRGINDFSLLIMKIIFMLVVAVFFINTLDNRGIFESLLFAVALAVGLTPELLPMVIALNLARGSAIMSRQGVIVKRPSAIQSFGSMDVLCTDKTGTLTEDKITLITCVDGAGGESLDVYRAVYLNSYYQSGFLNPLDSAVVESKKITTEGYRKVDETPFDYIRKRNTVVLDGPEGRALITKGAPEELLRACRFSGSEGTPLDEKARAQIEETYRNFSMEGFRVLGVARRMIEGGRERYGNEDERDLVFLGFAAFLDPPKKTATETLRKLTAYGIAIKIVTGDNDLVSRTIAKKLSLPVQGVLTGGEIEKLSDDALRVRAEETTIFARVSPDQKTRIIRSLQRNGHTVGYMGDGINDAASIKAADVGISVNNAVDVAKESADLILLHKSLSTLVDGVREGRKTFSNTLKYLMMTLSSNFGNMFSMAGASLVTPFLPMLPTQILLNNLIYDASQLAIPLDNVDPEDIRKPRKLDIAAIRKFMMVFGPLSSFFDLLTFLLLLFVFRLAEPEFQTGWFIESLATQTLVIYAIRSRSSFFASKPHPALVGSSVLALLAGIAIIVSPLGSAFKFGTISLSVMLSIALIVILYLAAVYFLKRWFYRKIFA